MIRLCSLITLYGFLAMTVLGNSAVAQPFVGEKEATGPGSPYPHFWGSRGRQSLTAASMWWVRHLGYPSPKPGARTAQDLGLLLFLLPHRTQQGHELQNENSYFFGYPLGFHVPERRSQRTRYSWWCCHCCFLVPINNPSLQISAEPSSAFMGSRKN